MNREAAIHLLDRLHQAQNEFHAGGSGTTLHQLLAPDITWSVPGDNRIARTYRGLAEVLDYFRRRRDLAHHTFQLELRDVLVGEGDQIAGLTNGFATIRNVDQRWSTVAPYHVVHQQITACWRSRWSRMRLTRSGPAEQRPPAPQPDRSRVVKARRR